MFFIVLWRPSKWLKDRQGITPVPYWAQAGIFFLIGIYGGFIQAGVGFFLLAGLVLGAGYDLVRANAVKVFIVLLYTPVALAFFIYNHQVNFAFGFILAAGSMLGAWVGAKVAVQWGAKFVRYVLLATVLIASIKLLGLF